MRWRIFVAVLLLFFPIDLIIYFLHIFGLFPKIYLMDKRLGKCFYWSSKSSELNLKIPHHQLSRGRGSKIDDQVETGEG